MPTTSAPLLPLLSLAVLLAAALSANAQPTARKFDELYYEPHDEQMIPRLQRFAQQVKREKARGYIIGYASRVIAWENYNRSYGKIRAEQAAAALARFIDYRRITSIDGGAREKAVTELWIIPRGAQLPAPTPTVKPEDVAECPFLWMQYGTYVPRVNGPLQFKVDLHSHQPKVKPSFTWQVSLGRIVQGQGTNAITVEVPENTVGKLIVKVNVNGYSLECPEKSTSKVTRAIIGVEHFKFDQYGAVCEEDEKARLDNFTIALQDSPESNAYVVYYGGRCYSSCGADYPRHRPHYPRKGEAERRGWRILDYLLNSRGISKDRIFLLDGGHRESFEAELWLVPKGAPPPPLSPTVLPQDIKYKAGPVTKRELTAGCLPRD